MIEQENNVVIPSTPDPDIVVHESSDDKLISQLGSGKWKKYVRLFMAALSSIPWVGGVISATASFSAEKEQERINVLQKLWLEEHKEKIKELNETLGDVFSRFDGFGDSIKERIEAPEYLALVKRTFRSWDQADTKEKKQMLKKLITNAGALELCDDDLVRLFINWIDQYHEAHFLVIKEIYQNPGITRGDIWESIHGTEPREDSSEADLFKYLIRDLSTGGVIRQERETNSYGEFIRRSAPKRGKIKSTVPRTMESAFENTKPYELTELGKEFVHYVMEDVVQQIGTEQA